MKRTLTGIAAAAMVLGTMAPAAFAATTATATHYAKWNISLGSYNQSVSGVVAQDSGHATSFLPIFYLEQALKGAGYTVTWSGSALSLTTPGTVKPDLTNLAPGNGALKIYLNGTLVQEGPVVVAKDPNNGYKNNTSFVPVWYVEQVLKRVGFVDTATFPNWNMSAPLAILSAKQTAATKVAVTFTKAVPTGTTVTLTQNGVDYNAAVTWDSTNTVATLTTGYSLPAGTYTVTSGTLTQTVTLAAATPTAINVSTKGLSTVADATVHYTIVDQFGNDVTSTAGTVTVNAVEVNKDGNYYVTSGASTQGSAVLNLSSAYKGDTVVVTLVDATDSLSQTVTLPIVGVSEMNTLTFGAASDNGSAHINSGDTGVLSYTATNASGDAVKFTANQPSGTGFVDDYQFLSSDPTVVNATSFGTDADSNLTFTAGAGSGTTTITAVNLSTGSISKATVTVGNVATVTKFTVSAPNKMVKVGSAVAIPYTAVDGFGTAIAQADFIAGDQSQVSVTSSNIAVLPSDFDSTNPTNSMNHVYFSGADNSLNVVPVGAGTTTLYVYVGGVLQNSITITANAASYPVAITGLNSLTTEFENDVTATETVDASNFKFIDQYNQAYTPVNGDTITVSMKSGSPVITLPGTFAGDATGTLLTPTTTVGSEVLTVTISDPGTTTHTASYDFNASTVAATSVTGYSISAPTTLYDGANLYVDGLTATDYAQAVTVNGTDGSGHTVVLPFADQAPNYITSSDATKVSVNGASVSGVASGTATITAFNVGGTKLGTATVTVSDVQPAAKTVSFSQSSFSGAYATATASALSALLTVTDQYGVTLPVTSAGGFGFWTSSNPAVITGGATPAGVGAGTATLTYIAPNGVSASITVSLS